MTVCPQCKNQMNYVEQYNQWYCYNCKQFLQQLQQQAQQPSSPPLASQQPQYQQQPPQQIPQQPSQYLQQPSQYLQQPSQYPQQPPQYPQQPPQYPQQYYPKKSKTPIIVGVVIAVVAVVIIVAVAVVLMGGKEGGEEGEEFELSVSLIPKNPTHEDDIIKVKVTIKNGKGLTYQDKYSYSKDFWPHSSNGSHGDNAPAEWSDSFAIIKDNLVFEKDIYPEQTRNTRSSSGGSASGYYEIKVFDKSGNIVDIKKVDWEYKWEN